MLVQLRDFTKSPYAQSAERFTESWILFVIEELSKNANRDRVMFLIYSELARARGNTAAALKAIDDAIVKIRQSVFSQDRAQELDQLLVDSARSQRSEVLLAGDWIEHIELMARQIFLTCADPEAVPCERIKKQAWELFANLMTALSITDTEEGVRETFNRFTEMCNSVLPGS